MPLHINGELPPAPPPIFVVRKTKVSPNKPAAVFARRQLARWKEPLHWEAPPAFASPGEAYGELGHDAYCEYVREYWAAVGAGRLEDARKAHTRWAVRLCVSKFETQVRGFWGQTVSNRGGIFNKASDVLVLPEELADSGRIALDFEQFLSAYGVRDWDLAKRLVAEKLGAKWGSQVEQSLRRHWGL